MRASGQREGGVVRARRNHVALSVASGDLTGKGTRIRKERVARDRGKARGSAAVDVDKRHLRVAIRQEALARRRETHAQHVAGSMEHDIYQPGVLRTVIVGEKLPSKDGSEVKEAGHIARDEELTALVVEVELDVAVHLEFLAAPGHATPNFAGHPRHRRRGIAIRHGVVRRIHRRVDHRIDCRVTHRIGNRAVDRGICDRSRDRALSSDARERRRALH